MLTGESVEVLTGTPTVDPYSGEDGPVSWTNPTVVVIHDVLCEPRPSGEPAQEGRNAVTSGFTCYFQVVPAVVPSPANRLRVRGVDYEVLGEPADWRSGSFRGLVIQTELTTG